MVQIFVSINFDEQANGKILPTLMNLSDVAKVLNQPDQRGNNKAVKILVDKIIWAMRLLKIKQKPW